MLKKSLLVILILTTCGITVESQTKITVQRLNGIRFADQCAGTDTGAKVNACFAELPANGGTIFVPSSLTSAPFATGIVVGTASKPTHLIFECGRWTYTGSGAAITTSSNSGSGTVIEGCSAGDENVPANGTSVTTTNTAAGGLDMQNCQSCTVRNISFVGPGSGTGIGAHMSGNGFVMDNVEVDLFGGDGVQLDGTRANSNSFILKRVKSHGNGGKGFNTFGVNSNLGTWIGTNGMSNTGTQYVFNNTFDHAFVALHAQPPSDVTAIQFIGSNGNWGSVYMEPQSPFAANVITFDASSLNNNLFLFNGRKVSDLGTGNLVYFSASDAGANIAGWYQGIRQTLPSSLPDGGFGVTDAIERPGSNQELIQSGIYFKSASVLAGFLAATKSSINFDYNIGATGYHYRIYNNCALPDISLCGNPAFDLDGSGNASFSGSVKPSSYQAVSVKVQAFTASGTFTIPAGVTSVKVTVIGGGGAGGGGTVTAAGQGGGSGGTSIKYLSALTPGNTLTVTVGTGGAGASASAGGNGVASTVASGTQTISTITANGGTGGGLAGANAGAGGAVGSGGDLNYQGSSGTIQAVSGGTGNGGVGGASSVGGAPIPGQNGGNGNAGGTNTGAGGSGGGGAVGNTTGGAGAAGIVVFEWTT